MHTDWLPALLQNCDSLFPSGAYAHSSGLEEMVRLGQVRDEATLNSFLENQVLTALQNLDLPYVHAAHRAGLKSDLQEIIDICDEVSAWKLCRETREASLQMGRGRLTLARRISPHPSLEALANSPFSPHLLAVYGWQMAVLGVPAEPTLSGYYYQVVAGFCSASLKLIRLGPEGAQRVLARALRHTNEVVTGALTITREEAGWLGPLLDIAAMRHERAEERLFIS